MEALKFTIATLALFLALAITVDAQVIDVTAHGAKPNADISQALLDSWKLACASPTSSKIVIPAGTYMLGQVSLLGPCQGPVEIQLDGTVQAPQDVSKFTGEPSWITLERIDFLTISGKGTFDGQGEAAWKANDCAKNDACKMMPISLRINFVTNSIITGVTSLNSKNFHVNLLGCKNLTFDHFTVSAPKESLNTDGIHVGRSEDIKILNTDIKTGDDCISIGDGSKKITITKVTCGPGHGISIGSLGKYKDEEPVEGVTVTDCTFTDTENGVRIKTWPDSFANTASDIHFSGITVNNVVNPVVIDQVYCPWNQCNPKVPSKVKLSNISVKGVQGTSSSPLAVKLACSSGLPCENVEIGDIKIAYKGAEPVKSECTNAKPTFIGVQDPPITC